MQPNEHAVRAAVKLKGEIRVQALANRDRQENKAELSRLIWDRLSELPEFIAARAISTYVSQPSEVATMEHLPRLWAAGKQVSVPCCVAGCLELHRIENTEELAPRTLGILEPRAEVRRRTDRKVEIAEIDLVLVPGVAFDRTGGRVGYGKRYYDKLLSDACPGTPLVGLAFECQLFPNVPMLGHDVGMTIVITEKATYPGSSN